jgi:hypothetical protein
VNGRPIDDGELIDAIGSVERYAFRWEHQRFYDEPGEAELLAEWKAGGPGHPGHDHVWVDMLAELRDRGAQLVRVRVQDDPLPEYQAWLAGTAVTWNIAAGEHIRVMPRSRARWITPLLSPRGHDWWLLDGRRIVLMKVDDAGRRVSTELHDGGPAVVWARAWRDVAFRLSTPAPNRGVLTPT